jgi:hypothetical protein
MRYYNYLTTPSGKKCKLNEIANRDYLILLKFLNGDNYEGFYEKLDSLISETIPDFIDFDIVDKAYIYIAFYFYSIKASIGVKAEKFDMVEVPLTTILDSIENSYIKTTKKGKFYKWDNCEITYPNILEIEDDNININYVSGLISVNGVELTTQNKIDLAKNAPLQALNEIESFIKNNFNSEIYFCKDQIGVNDIRDNIINPGLFHSIAYIYKESLEQFYNMMYLMCHYIRISWDNLLDFTPIELSIIYNDFVEDKEEQNKKQKKHKGSINLADPNISDSLMGY